MSNFDSKEFGEKIRNYRTKKGLSQENLAMALNKSTAIISRYENGTVIPNAKDISIICEELEIYEADLFENGNYKTTQKSKSINPFGTNTLYVYFNAYNFRTKKFGKDKYKLEFSQKQDICKARFVDYHDERVYSEGYLIANEEIVFITMENYKPTSTRIDICEFEINICNGTDKLMLGAYFGTNAKCEPSLRKCYFSKKDIEFTDEMFNNLKLNENEKEILDTQNALYLDIFNI